MNDATPPKKSDLGVRTLSAVVMIAVAGTALWLGGWVWTALVALVVLGVLWEFSKLAFAFVDGLVGQAMWLLSGIIYLVLAGAAIVVTRSEGLMFPLTVILLVVAVDIGAYTFGRMIGGPKIAPSISPSKTWAGLAGGVLGAFVVMVLGLLWNNSNPLSSSNLLMAVAVAVATAVLAQAGDFFESWMKRKAGVKDSGTLIPGHGGLFDRVDGHLAIFAALGLVLVYDKLTYVPHHIPVVY